MKPWRVVVLMGGLLVWSGRTLEGQVPYGAAAPPASVWTTMYPGPYTYPHPLDTGSATPACTGAVTADNTQPVVQARVTAANSADTICLCTPGVGGCPLLQPVWTAAVTSAKGINLVGPLCTLTTVNNIAGVPTNFNACPVRITLSTTQAFIITGDGFPLRLAHFSLTGSVANATGDGAFQLDGTFGTAPPNIRIDHVMISNLADISGSHSRAFEIGTNNQGLARPPIYGLIDHINYQQNISSPMGRQYGDASSPYPNAWSLPDRWGSNQAFYIEDSNLEWTWPGSGANLCGECTVWDQEGGSRAVLRHNFIRNATWQGHDTASTEQNRSERIKEGYSNVFVCTPVGTFDCGFGALELRGGSDMYFDNQIAVCTVANCAGAPAGWENGLVTELWRIDGGQNPPHPDATSAPWGFMCANAGTISNASIANPTVLTYAPAELYVAGQQFVITGAVTTPTINGTWNVTPVTSTTVTIPVNVTAFTSGGTFTVNNQLNIAADFRSHCDDSGTTQTYPVCGFNESFNAACSASTCPSGLANCGVCTSNPSAALAAKWIAATPSIPVLGPGGTGWMDGTSAAGGYPCRDQTGRGMDSATHRTQALMPPYFWNNTNSNGSTVITTVAFGPSNNTYLQVNRDLFLTDDVNCPAGAANTCLRGIGRGTFLQRPAACNNADFPGSVPGPGYVDSAGNVLYTCTR